MMAELADEMEDVLASVHLFRPEFVLGGVGLTNIRRPIKTDTSTGGSFVRIVSMLLSIVFSQSFCKSDISNALQTNGPLTD